MTNTPELLKSIEPGLWIRATTRTDRWLVFMTGLLIVITLIYSVSRPRGAIVVIIRDNQPVLTLSLAIDQQTQVNGRLGPVTIQIHNNRVRLLEYNSPRQLGMRRGWISSSGAILACVPCGILIQIDGNKPVTDGSDHLDGIAR